MAKKNIIPMPTWAFENLVDEVVSSLGTEYLDLIGNTTRDGIKAHILETLNHDNTEIVITDETSPKIVKESDLIKNSEIDEIFSS